MGLRSGVVGRGGSTRPGGMRHAGAWHSPAGSRSPPASRVRGRQVSAARSGMPRPYETGIRSCMRYPILERRIRSRPSVDVRFPARHLHCPACSFTDTFTNTFSEFSPISASVVQPTADGTSALPQPRHGPNVPTFKLANFQLATCNSTRRGVAFPRRVAVDAGLARSRAPGPGGALGNAAPLRDRDPFVYAFPRSRMALGFPRTAYATTTAACGRDVRAPTTTAMSQRANLQTFQLSTRNS
jgi:hypothetical protein